MLSKTKEVISARGAFGDALVELGETNPNIVVLDADVSASTQTKKFATKFPERFFNMGISEQDMISTAAGLSTCNKIPFVAAFAVFASGRAWEQVRNSVCYPNFNVKIVGTHGGITVGEDGATHQALEDVAVIRSIPNIVVLCPCDGIETKKAIKWAAEYKGPVYIRVARSSLESIYDETSYNFDLEAKVLKEGTDLTLVSSGETVIEAMKAAEILSNEGVSVEVISCVSIKQFDKKAIIKSAQKTGKVVTLENHSIIGGLGGVVCETLSENYPVPVLRIGTPDSFGQSGTAKELMVFYGLDSQNVAFKIKEFLRK